MLSFKNRMLFILFFIIFCNQLISSANLEMKNEFLDKCMNNCINGDCNKNDECICLPNYGSYNCNNTCTTVGSFGTECEFNCYDLLKNKDDCQCFNSKNLLMNSNNTTCNLKCNCMINKCGPGFMGKQCSPCNDNYYGINCLEKCKCNAENTLECNKRNGDCKCKPSFFGIFCDESCESNTYLYCDTMQRCKCINNLSKFNESNQLNELDLLTKLSDKDQNIYNKSETIVPDYTFFTFILLSLIIIGLVIYIFKIQKKSTKKNLNNEISLDKFKFNSIFKFFKKAPIDLSDKSKENLNEQIKGDKSKINSKCAICFLITIREEIEKYKSKIDNKDTNHLINSSNEFRKKKLEYFNKEIEKFKLKIGSKNLNCSGNQNSFVCSNCSFAKLKEETKSFNKEIKKCKLKIFSKKRSVDLLNGLRIRIESFYEEIEKCKSKIYSNFFICSNCSLAKLSEEAKSLNEEIEKCKSKIDNQETNCLISSLNELREKLQSLNEEIEKCKSKINNTDTNCCICPLPILKEEIKSFTEEIDKNKSKIDNNDCAIDLSNEIGENLKPSNEEIDNKDFSCPIDPSDSNKSKTQLNQIFFWHNCK